MDEATSWSVHIRVKCEGIWEPMSRHRPGTRWAVDSLRVGHRVVGSPPRGLGTLVSWEQWTHENVRRVVGYVTHLLGLELSQCTIDSPHWSKKRKQRNSGKSTCSGGTCSFWLLG